LLSLEVGELPVLQHTPLTVTVLPLSFVTLPPHDAPEFVIFVTSDVVKIGTLAGSGVSLSFSVQLQMKSIIITIIVLFCKKRFFSFFHFFMG
jgi:hypothetical protein